METRAVRRSKIGLSVIGMGCWAFSDPKFWGAQDERDTFETIAAALDGGVTFFDTAEGYGNGASETILGRALKGKRNRAVIATKMVPARNGYAELLAACDDSLRRLQTDYIDLYQVHWPNREVPFTETAKALELLKTQGKIRAIGVCNFGRRDLPAFLQACPEVATNQMVYNLLWRAIEEEVVPLCREHGLGVICYSSLLQGLLTGRYEKLEDTPLHLRQTKFLMPPLAAETFASLAELRRLSRESGIPMHALAIRWTLAQPAIISVLTGARTATEIAGNIRALETAVPQDVMEELGRITASMKQKVGGDLDIWTDGRIR